MGLPIPAIGCENCIEGDDATPLLDEPGRPRKTAAFSQYARCNKDAVTGYYTRCLGEAGASIFKIKLIERQMDVVVA